MRLFLMLHQLVPPVELLQAEVAVVFGVLAVELHVRSEIVLVLEPAFADLALVLRCLAALHAKMSLQAGVAQIETVAVRAFVGGLSPGGSGRVVASTLRLHGRHFRLHADARDFRVRL